MAMLNIAFDLYSLLIRQQRRYNSVFRTGNMTTTSAQQSVESAHPQSTVWSNMVAGLLSLILFGLAFQNWWQPDRVISAFQPTPTMTPSPTPKIEPTVTPTPIPTLVQSISTPVIFSVTPFTTPSLPTVTPMPKSPYTHTVATGEVLFNVALAYDVSVASILDSNEGLSPEGLYVGQRLIVPRPTATPPLVPVDITINGEPAVADPTDCVQHEITQNETLFAIAVRYDVTLDALLRMNRIDTNAFLRIGNVICIPTIIFNAKAISLDSNFLEKSMVAINQPTMLYPSADTTLTQMPITVQWVAERELLPGEQYMVELTYLDDLDARPIRAFTRQTSWQLTEGESGRYRWRLSFVLVDENAHYRYQWNGPVVERILTISLP